MTVTCLINPRIKRGSLIKIRNNAKHNGENDVPAILAAQADLSYSGTNGGNKDTQAKNSVSGTDRYSVIGLAPGGMYRVISAEHEGDTRGDAWYTRSICLAVDPSAPTAKSTAVVTYAD